MNIKDYFQEIEDKVRVCYSVAEEARRKGQDPVSRVEIPLAANLAEKCLGLISTIYPQINDAKIVNRILELEKQHGPLDMAVAFKIAEEIAKEKFCKFSSLLEAIDAGIRVGFAYITLGVVSSPIEGFTELKIGKTRDGKEYFVANFSGPIRSAGTTASCMVLILIDYLRELFGYAKFDPSEKEVKRYISENYDYHERVTNLQYLPTEEEIEFLATNMPIQISGEPTEKREVSNYKDLERVGTNFIRGGMCLIFSEGLAQKAQKALGLYHRLQLKGFQLSGWNFLDEYVKLHKKRVSGTSDTTPTYIKDIVAGRPVFSHPSRSGGFRFRYGKSRVNGFSATSVHPATMAISGCFLSTGTQLKIEKPTKGCAITSCDSIDGPIVKLTNGNVRRVKSFEEAKKLYKDVKEIIYLGDILFSLGDVINRNYELLKTGYVEEWWALELEKALSPEEASEISDKKQNLIINNIKEEIIKVNKYNISIEQAMQISERYKIPLHPKYIFYWTQISYEEFLAFLDWIAHCKLAGKVILPYSKTDRERFQKGKRAFELLGIEHDVTTENVVLSEQESKALFLNLGIDFGMLEKSELNGTMESICEKIKGSSDVLEAINKISRYKIKDKAGTFIGARMGRPEKAKLRKLTGSPSVLFPVGEEGGRFRSVNDAVEVGSIKAEFPIYQCKKCNKETIYFICEDCGSECQDLRYCKECGQKFTFDKCPEHMKAQSYMNKRIDSKHYFKKAIDKLNMLPEEIPALIKGVKGTSNENHVPENLAKGFLRSLFKLCVNKDGTIRYDATELPVTHFKPAEIGTGIEKLREMGYLRDIYGKPLENEEQILEIKPHDIILPSCPESQDERADDVFVNIARFVDSLLVRFYGLKPFYNIKSKEDIIGHLSVCMAPHNCAGVITRIIGFSKVQGLFASPYLHAAVRRDCAGYHSYVSIKGKNGWEIKKIGEFVNKLNPQQKADNFGTLKKEIGGYSCWSNPGEETIKEVTKHAPRKMIRIFLEDGRKIEVTENHKVYLKGKIEKRAGEIQKGDLLSVGYKKDIAEKDIEEIFLPEIFREKDYIMIRNIRNFLNSIEKLDKSSNYYLRDSFPIKIVEEILTRNGRTLRNLPSEAKISAKRDRVLLPIKICLDSELLEVLGLYIAEGYSRSVKGKKGLNQVYIASSDKKIREFVEKVFLSHFGLKKTENKNDRSIFSSRIVYELFIDSLGMGGSAREKRIPSLLLDLKKEKIASLLRGYFEGDGSVSLSDIRVTCDSVSEGLKHDLSFVLSRFGIFTKFYDYEKEPGPKVREFYIRKGRKIPKFKITKIIIPSDFVRSFKEIGFLSEKKKNILERLFMRIPAGMRIEHDECYAYPKVVRIEDAGEKESYCLNVTSEHNFFANDILVHNCDGDEVAIMLLLDVLINFSRKFLPAHRGGTQDAPLVLNSRINAGEVDDQILDLELGKYPLELYELAEKGEHSSKVNIETVRKRLKEGKNPLCNAEFTHDCLNFNAGVINSSYKSLPTMQEKVEKQMELVEKLRATDATDVARLIIERHFIRDIRGNLRKFSQQEFRCVKCNEKFRRPPLSGTCTKCSGRIIFTISEGSIVKYLEPALGLARKYNVPPYVLQNLELTRRYIESIFGREKEKQADLKGWF